MKLARVGSGLLFWHFSSSICGKLTILLYWMRIIWSKIIKTRLSLTRTLITALFQNLVWKPYFQVPILYN